MLAALEAGAAFFILVSVPHTGPGYSFTRFGMLALLVVLFILWIYIAFRSPQGFAFLAQPVYALIAGSTAVLISITLFLLRFLDPVRYLPIYVRLSPILFYLFVLTIQFSLFILVIRFGLHFENLLNRRSVYLSALYAFCVLLLLYLFIVLTHLGIKPDKAYWGEPGVPLMGWQLASAVLAGLIIFLIGLWISNPSRVDLILPLVLWFLAVIFWLTVPLSVLQNSFYAPINPPADLPFPNSDAGYYDSMAQSLLIGYPYLGTIPTRPLYITFLAFLHLLLGERYDLIIVSQTLILALIPVLLYFLGKRLHSRPAGVIVALFAIFREWTSLLISSQTRVSNTKTLLVDLPTLLLILLTSLFVLRWLERKDWKSGLLVGGSFGILLLLRTQSMLILPGLFILVFLVYGLHIRSWVLALAFFLIGFGVSIAPWLLHNYLSSGQLTFDAPFQYQVIASQYQYTGNLDLQNIDLQGKSLIGILLAFTLKDPQYVFGFIATHFFATQLNGLLALPLIEPYNGLLAPLNLYWMTWDGSLSLPNTLLIFIYLAVIAVGLAAVWKRLRWIGFVPLVFSLGYSLANGVGRFSGWRYDLPADWVAYFYFGIGIAEIFGIVALVFGALIEKKITVNSIDRPTRSNWSQGFLIFGVFTLIGGLPWLVKNIASPRFEKQTEDILVGRLSDSSAVRQLGVNRDQINGFISAPNATLQIGRELYPRFFTRSLGLSSTHPWPAYAPRDFPRLGFILIGGSRNDAVFPTRSIPDPFPSGADAIVLGCWGSDYIDVRLILFPDSDIAYLSEPLTESCN